MHDEHHFAPGILDGDLLRCSGMLGLRPDLSLPADPAAQFTQAFENLRGLLELASLTFADVVEMTSYHVGLRRHFAVFAAVKDRFLAAPYPAWTAVGVVELAVPGALVEIALTARLGTVAPPQN